ncbi:hypothetical protein [Polaribacter sp.]|uniref:hypothetical protein n=1 Tax=Polaribacter sp. TaxID=1920175 RepID=UPI003EF85EEF
MKNYIIIVFAFLIFSNISCSQENVSFGEKRDLKLGKTTAYTKIKIGEVEGYYLIDFGTTLSTIDIHNFINGKPKPAPNSINKFDNFDFFGKWKQVTLNIQDHSNITGLKNFKQAGIIGSDFLTNNIFTFDYEKKLLFRSNKENFLTNKELKDLGFKAISTVGYFSNNQKELNNSCTFNVPTIPIKIGEINAIAQVDSGFDDSLFSHSININQAFYNAIVDAGIILIENPSANLLLSTCKTGVNQLVKAYKLPKGTSFAIISIDGSPIELINDVNIFLKNSTIETFSCGGIGTWKIPAGQIGASFLSDNKKVIFDPFESKIWFLKK